MRDKIKNFNAEKMEILLYGYKFVILCSLGNENSLYKNLFNEKFNNIINNIFIPGYEPFKTDKMLTYEAAEKHFKEVPGPSPGFYVCNKCNYCYLIENCSNPYVISNCVKCGQKIGGENRELLDGSRRIYRNENERNSFPHLYGITLAQFEKEVKEDEKLEPPGFRKIQLIYFKNNNKQVRNLNGIAYRTLNFIFYSIIYFNNILDYINDNDIQNYFMSGKNISDIIDEIWKCLKNLLGSQSINNIKIFINSIFPKIND